METKTRRKHTRLFEIAFSILPVKQNFFSYILTFTISPSANYIFISCDHFFQSDCNDFFSYCSNYLYILDINSLLVINAVFIIKNFLLKKEDRRIEFDRLF